MGKSEDSRDDKRISDKTNDFDRIDNVDYMTESYKPDKEIQSSSGDASSRKDQ